MKIESSTGAEFGRWTADGNPQSIEFPRTLWEEILPVVMGDFLRLAWGGAEVGGVLFGRREPDCVQIQAFRPLAIEHVNGPAFELSENDSVQLGKLLAKAETDPELAGLEAVGWYHSNYRWLGMSPRDVAAYDRHFPKPWQVSMVFLRMKAQPCLLGFFYRRTDGSIGSSSCEFSVREVKPEAPQPPKPEPEAHPEPAPPPKPAAKPALALKPEPAPKPVPARAPEPAPKPKPVLEAAPGPARVVPVQTSLTFWGLGEKPFSRPSAAHLNPRQEDVLSRLMYAIRRRDGLTVLTGEPETGKTTLLERLGDCLSEEAIEFAFLLDPRVSTGQLYEFLAYDLALARGRRSQGDIVESLRELLISQAANGSTVVLLIDDAHNLEWEVLEEIRLLDNLQHRSGRLLQTVLCGSPELDRRLDSEQLRDLRERVAVRCRLQLPSEEETARWIEQQLAECGMPDQTVFSREILSAIFVRSGGVFRVAGAICDALLEACFARGSRIATMEMLDDVWPGLHLTANCD